MNKGKKNLGVKIETALLEKLDQEAVRTRRTRSQTIEVLIDNLSIDSNSIIEDQAKKIKELERDVILLRSDKTIDPIDDEVIQDNKRLVAENTKLKKTTLDQRQAYIELCSSIQALYNQINE